MRLVALSLLCAVTLYGQGSQTPIYNGLLQSDLNAAGFKILSSNMADYAGTGMTWNVVTGKFDVTGGGGGGTPGGATTQMQYNNAGAFGGVTNFVTDGTNVAIKGSTADSVEMRGTQDDITFRNTVPNTATYFRVMPNGSVANFPSAFTFYGTDRVADPSNYERLFLYGRGSGDLYYVLGTDAAGTGVRRPLLLTADASSTQLLLNTNGNVSIGTNITGNGTVPVGGTTNQVLAKTSNTDYAIGWATSAGGVTSITGTAPISVTPTTGAAVASLTAPLGATYMPAFTGDVTTSSGAVATTIGNSKVTYAKIQNVSANSRLLGAGSAGTGLPPAEITVGSGLTMTGTTLTAAGGTGTVTNTGGNLTANSVVLGAGTVDTKVVPGVITDGTSKITLGVSTTSVGSIALNNLTSGSVTIQPATGALSTATMTIPAGATNPVVADTGAANNYLTGISSAGVISKAQPVVANLSDATTVGQSFVKLTNPGAITFPEISATNVVSTKTAAQMQTDLGLVIGTNVQAFDSDLTTWAGITPGINVGKFLATPSSANLRGALTDENGTGAALFSGATTPDFTTGFTIGAAATSRKMMVGNGTNYVPSTETWAVPGAATNFLKSDGTNWTAAQPAFSSLSGSATAAQMPAFTGDVTSVAGATANTLVNIPATTTIAGVSGTRGDVLYYGATGWAKLGAGSSGNQLTTNGAGADPTWAAAGGGSGSPGGANTNIQYNDSSAFGGDANLVWDKTAKKLTVSGGGATDSAFKLGNLEFQPFALNNSWISDNVYYDGAGFKYRATGNAGQFYFFGNEGQFRFGNGGTAGGAFTGFAQLKVNYLGNFAVGNQVAGANADFSGSYLYLKVASPALQLASNFGYAWSSSTDASAALDTGLNRNAAGVVEINNGTPGTYKDLKADHLNAVTGFQVNGAAPTNYELTGNGTNFVSKASDIPNGSSAQQTGFASNTYLAGSLITLSAGDFKVGSTYRCIFDMTKTTAGTAAPVITIYIGTAGSTADTAAQTITFAAATGVADTGMFEVWVNFRAVGASATISSVGRCIHNLAITGLTSTGASGSGTVSNSTSSTFNSTTFTKIGCAFNGGTSYVGTNNLVQAYYSNP